jgi:hypothetical protein
MIYFIQAIDGGLIKIGLTSRPSIRLSQIQVWSPIILRILATMDGDSNVEVALHDRFRRHRRHGEWFDPDPEILDLIAQHEVMSQRCSRQSLRRRTTPTITQVYCPPSFLRWICSFADSEGISISDLVVRAAEHHAATVAFDVPPSVPSIPSRKKIDRSFGVFFIRTDPSWRAWLNQFADHLGVNNSRLICQSLADYGRSAYPVELPSFLQSCPKMT